MLLNLQMLQKLQIKNCIKHFYGVGCRPFFDIILMGVFKSLGVVDKGREGSKISLNLLT